MHFQQFAPPSILLPIHTKTEYYQNLSDAVLFKTCMHCVPKAGLKLKNLPSQPQVWVL